MPPQRLSDLGPTVSLPCRDHTARRHAPVKPGELTDTTQHQRSFARATPVALTPLTGRDTEVSLLADRWEQAQEGMGQVVLVIGEPGLGKSRLVDTIKERVLAEADHASQVPAIIDWRCALPFQ